MAKNADVFEVLEVAGANGISRIGHYSEDKELAEEIAVELEDGSIFVLFGGKWRGVQGIKATWLTSEGEERVADKQFTWFELPG